jgi:hypothetical protein
MQEKNSGIFFLSSSVLNGKIYKKTRAEFSARDSLKNLYVMLWALPSSRHNPCYGFLRLPSTREIL